MSNTTIVAKLIAGHKRFTTSFLARHEQQPKAMVIACCDSRVDPAIITDSALGELFVVRNIANLVPPYNSDRDCSVSAALEFGVLNLKVSDIIVLGHKSCGGIRALMEAQTDNEFVNKWMETAKPAKQKVLKQYPNCSLDEQAHFCEKESLLMSLDNLKTFPWINERVSTGKLSLHGWYFNLETGMIETYENNQ